MDDYMVYVVSCYDESEKYPVRILAVFNDENSAKHYMKNIADSMEELLKMRPSCNYIREFSNDWYIGFGINAFKEGVLNSYNLTYQIASRSVL